MALCLILGEAKPIVNLILQTQQTEFKELNGMPQIPQLRMAELSRHHESLLLGMGKFRDPRPHPLLLPLGSTTNGAQFLTRLHLTSR